MTLTYHITAGLDHPRVFPNHANCESNETRLYTRFSPAQPSVCARKPRFPAHSPSRASCIQAPWAFEFALGANGCLTVSNSAVRLVNKESMTSSKPLRQWVPCSFEVVIRMEQENRAKTKWYLVRFPLSEGKEPVIVHGWKAVLELKRVERVSYRVFHTREGAEKYLRCGAPGSRGG